MINLTKDNIDKAIVNKAYDMVRKSEAGYLYTDETVCTFNSMLIFRDLFNNKCRMLDCAFEKLYYIADKIIQCVRPNPEDKLYSVTVVTSPSNSIVTINGVTTKQRNLTSGSKVTIIAKLDGYYDKTYTIQSLEKDETVEITFTDEDKLPRYFNINVTTIPSDAICKINGVVTKSAKILENETCSIEVTADGYLPYSNIFTVTEDKDINVKLETVPEEDIIITVNPTPSDATVLIDGVEGNVRTVKKGNHTVVVKKTGMNTYNLNQYFGTNTVLEPELTITISVVTIPSDATVLINGSQRKTITGLPGEYTIEVSKTGYISKTIRKEYSLSSNEEIRLEEEVRNATITVNAQPAGAVVKIDGITTISKTVPVGTSVNVNVTLNGYIPFNQRYTVNEDMTVNVTLKNTQTVNLLCYKYDELGGGDVREGVVVTYTVEGDETVYNYVNDSVIEMPVNKDITFVCTAEGYATETRKYNFTGNYLVEIIAVPIYPEEESSTEFTLTVQTASGAVVTIDGEITEQKVVSAGSHTIVVSKDGYTTVTKVVNVTTNTTVNIELEAEISTVNLSVVATPNDSIITIDNDNVSSKDVTPGTSHTIVVRKTGYATYTEVVTVNENTTLEVTLKNTKTVRYNVLKEDTTDYSDIILDKLENGQYVALPIGENIEVPFDTDITVRTTAPGYQVVTRTDNFSSNASNAYDVTTINILIPVVVSSKVRITLRDIPYQATRKVNGATFTGDYVDVDAGSLVIIDITASGYTNNRIVLIPTEDKTISVSMTSYTPNIGNNILFHFEGSNFNQLFTIDNSINSSHGGYLEISKGTHKVETHLNGGNSLIEFTDIYNDNTDFYILID